MANALRRQSKLPTTGIPGSPANSAAEDEAAHDPHALDRETLERFISETRMEPPWRREADMDAEYYDGNQLTAEILAEMQERGIPPLIINLTQPIINSVLGMEAKTRADWRITADNKQSEIVAKRLSEELNEAERESEADRAIAEAYGGQIKAGLGWVEVGRETDPFAYPYRVNFVHRREIWWDWRAKDPGLSDARYLIRRKWYDEDILLQMLPQHGDLIKYAINSWGGFGIAQFQNQQGIELAHSFDTERASTLDEFEWRDTYRHRCQLFEVWYRKWVRGHVLRLPNNRVIEVDRKNPRHMEVIASGYLQPLPAVFPKVRVSMWLGPHRLSDIPTPFSHRSFPYVPFWGFREDITGVPYGLIRALRSPQDEVNARRSKLLSLLTGRRIIADDDSLNKAYNTFEDVADEVGRSDGVVILNSKRTNLNSGFKIENNGDLAPGQMKSLEDSKNEMHQVSGIFPPTMGDPKQGLSGYAINSLVDQSATTLAAINDNYRFGRRLVGELLLTNIREDLVHPHMANVGEGKNARSYFFNTPAEDGSIQNSIVDATIKVTLSDVPSTASYRQQQFAALSEMTKGLPEQVQAMVIDFVIEASDVNDRDKVAERVRKGLGIPDPNADEQRDAEMQAQAQKYEQQIAELMQKVKPLMDENQRLTVENANRQGDAAAAIEREKTRQKEIETQQMLKAKEIDTDREMSLEKIDFDHEKLEADKQAAARDSVAQLAMALAKAKGEEGGVDTKVLVEHLMQLLVPLIERREPVILPVPKRSFRIHRDANGEMARIEQE